MRLRRPLFESRGLLAFEFFIVVTIVVPLYVFRDRNPIAVLATVIVAWVAASILILTIRGILGALPKPDQIPKPLPPDAGEGRDG